MSNELNLYYDEEGDFLELNIRDYTEGLYNTADIIVQTVHLPF